jgi:general secretion pathway protein C
MIPFVPVSAGSRFMLNDLISAWRFRDSNSGPWLVSSVLALLIALEVGNITLTLFAPGDIDARRPAAVKPIHAPDGPPVDVNSIVARHLFGVAEADPNSQDPPDATPSAANLVLAGVIAMHDPRRGIAIISEGGGPSKVYSVGTQVGGTTLHSVYLTYVLLERAGRLEKLILPNPWSAGEKSPAARARGKPAVQTSHVAVANAAADDPRQRADGPPANIADVMHFSPNLDSRAGNLRGFRVYPGRHRLAFNGFGMHGGDLVTAINGAPLQDQQSAQQLLDSIQTSGAATLTVDRNGRTQEITVDVASRGAAEAATNPPASE